MMMMILSHANRNPINTMIPVPLHTPLLTSSVATCQFNYSNTPRDFGGPSNLAGTSGNTLRTYL